MSMYAGRMFNRWLLNPIIDPTSSPRQWPETPSIPLLRENLRKHAEVAAYGRKRFSGSLSQKNSLWREHRNFLRQALSNFDAAIDVPNRSACLLYYYALLNFAKSELLATHASGLVGTFVGHGLSFSTYKAKSVAGDSLTVKNGVFKMLYEARTGHSLPVGAKLSIKRLLANIPEVGSQIEDTGIGSSRIIGVNQLIAVEGGKSWPVLLVHGSTPSKATSTGKLFFKYFKEAPLLPDWRDRFALSRRLGGKVQMFESIATVPHNIDTTPNIQGAMGITWKLKDVIFPSYSGSMDGIIAPSIYDSKMIPMPPSLARYAVIFYASSLVRYRPAMFDSQLFPAQALLFDAVARECAIPVLRDVLTALEGDEQIFYADDALRL